MGRAALAVAVVMVVWRRKVFHASQTWVERAMVLARATVAKHVVRIQHVMRVMIMSLSVLCPGQARGVDHTEAGVDRLTVLCGFGRLEQLHSGAGGKQIEREVWGRSVSTACLYN